MPAVADAVKRCRGCGQDRPLADFAQRPSRPAGQRQPRCQECLRREARERRAAARARDPEGERARWRAWSRTAAGERYKRAKTARRRCEFEDPATERFAVTVIEHDPCSYCGAPGGVADHIDALAVNGDGSVQNLTGACADCNRRKSALPLLAFLLRERLRG